MIIVFAGQIASGKSTLSKLLSEQTCWSRFSFGEYVGECARKIGLDSHDRETLQELGAVLAKHPTQFALGFLDWTGRATNLIIDGLRHVSVLDALRAQTAGQSLKLAFVDTPMAIAESRFEGDLSRIRRHVVEADIEMLKPLADWVLEDSSLEALQPILIGLGFVATSD